MTNAPQLLRSRHILGGDRDVDFAIGPYVRRVDDQRLTAEVQAPGRIECGAGCVFDASLEVSV